VGVTPREAGVSGNTASRTGEKAEHQVSAAAGSESEARADAVPRGRTTRLPNIKNTRSIPQRDLHAGGPGLQVRDPRHNLSIEVSSAGLKIALDDGIQTVFSVRRAFVVVERAWVKLTNHRRGGDLNPLLT